MGQHIWIHQDFGLKLDGCAAEARWVGFNSDSTHAHQVYWSGKNSVSVECNIKFPPVIATITFPTTTPSLFSLTPTTAAPTQPLTLTTQQVAATLPTPPTSVIIPAPAPSIITPTETPNAHASPLNTSLQTKPTATDSGKEELPDENEKPTTPKKAPASAPAKTTPQAPKKKTPPPPPTHKFLHLAAKSLQQGSQKTGSVRASGGASSRLIQWCHPNWKEPDPSDSEELHLIELNDDNDDDDDEGFIFSAEHDPLITATAQNASNDSKTVGEAHSCPDWTSWKAAMDKEINTLKKAGTWSTVSCPTSKNIIGLKWVFRTKHKDDSTIDKLKARLVAHSFTQIFDVDYFDTYSPVTKMASVRTILAMAAHFNWDIEFFNFNSAYLNGTLNDDEELYMHEPPRYESQGKLKVKQLYKSLYGLKQARRKWYDALTQSLANLGFCATTADPGVFLAKPDGNHLLILAIHIDNCILTSDSPKLIFQYKSKLNDCYALTDLGPIHWLLRIKITHDHSAHTISLSQTFYINSIISHFGLSNAKSYSTPMVPGIIHSQNECPSDPAEVSSMKKTPY